MLSARMLPGSGTGFVSLSHHNCIVVGPTYASAIMKLAFLLMESGCEGFRLSACHP